MSFDGRNIDSRRGILSGEAAPQDARGNLIQPEAFRSRPSQQTGLTTGDATYYDRPVIKKSPWSWDIPAYYFAGGATGASAALGAAALLLNQAGMPNLIRYVRWMGPAGGSLSAFFLIHDLGRPSRFLYMLRVFRPTSPMSVGAYILTLFSSFAGLSWIALFAPRSYRAVGNFAGIAAGVFGLGLAGYTGVLISNTVVPLWQRPHRIMPVLFLASGAASAASLLDFFHV
ncbi:MAG: polysulfide reductase NrfD, partial [Acidobacteriota bacterium]|nr:polysulfide reductase NrfD [Acidobacteriota bacterium]